MEQNYNGIEMLDLLPQSAFCVRNGKIIKVNPAAAALLIETGTDIQTLMHTGAEEYAAFESGCLYLTLCIAGHRIGASVSRMQDFDVFCLDEETDAHLQALALAARELREPLSNIMIITDRLFPKSAGDDAKAQEQLSHMNRGLYQMLRIVNNMSDASLYAADTAARREVRDINALLSEIFQRAAVLTEHTTINLHYEGLHEAVYTLADSQKLERMVFNMLSNAIKFTPDGGTVSAKLTRRDKKLYLSIRDSGSGIQEHIKGNVFSRYLRQPALEDRRYGLGLGMTLIRSTAALHGGTVLIDQPEDSGTRVTVSFSIQQGDAAVRSSRFQLDYAGERDHGLIELSDVLPAHLFAPDSIN